MSFSAAVKKYGILAAGVFAHAHVGVTVLQNLFRFLQREGVFLLTIRESYRDEMQEAFERLPWSLVRQEQFSIYEKDVMYILVFRKERSR